jgi:hypothetical protein
MHRAVPLGLALAFGLAAACASTRNDAGDLPTEASRAAFGRIAIVEVAAGGKTDRIGIHGDEVVDPAAAGLATGATWMLSSHISNRWDFAGAVLLLPVAIVVGGICAAASNPSAAERAEVQRIRTAVEAGVRTARVRDKLRRCFERDAWREHGTEVYWHVDPPRRSNGTVDVAAMAARGVDTVLELELCGVTAFMHDTADEFGFSLAVAASLIRTEDGAEICRRRLVYCDPTRLRVGSDWAEGHGLPIRAELERAVELLAARLAEDLFAHYRISGSVPR